VVDELRGALAVLLCAACAARQAGPDLATRSAAEARDADRGLAAAVAARDAEAFAGAVDESALFLGASGPSVGRASVLTDWAPLLTEGGPELRWAPDRTEAAASGDLVFTFGAWQLGGPAGDAPRAGRYLTVWRRGVDGLLRAVLDANDRPLPADLPGLGRRVLGSFWSADGALHAECGLLLEPTQEGPGRPAGHYVRLERGGASGTTLLTEAGALWPRG
jgi:ketosteroid isomerase-like protein